MPDNGWIQGRDLPPVGGILLAATHKVTVAGDVTPLG